MMRCFGSHRSGMLELIWKALCVKHEAGVW